MAPRRVGPGMPVGRLEPVLGRPALRIVPEDGGPVTLVVADLHLGLAVLESGDRAPPEGSTELLLEELLDTAHRARADSVVVAGDAKHPILGTPPRLRPVLFEFFAEVLRAGLSVELVLGNHDVGITRHLPAEVEVRPAAGVVRAGVGIFHGHRWPSNQVLRASRLVTGHLHPGYRLAPTPEEPEGKHRCWVRVVVPPRPDRKSRRRRRHGPIRAREIVVLPAFHPLAGTEALNRRRPSLSRSFLFHRFLTLGEARAFLFDGTDLGPLPTIDPVPA